MMALETVNLVNHDGVTYDVGTVVSKIKNLSDDQKDVLVANGSLVEPKVTTAVQNELAEKAAEVEALKVKIQELELAQAQTDADKAHKAAVEAEKK